MAKKKDLRINWEDPATRRAKGQVYLCAWLDPISGARLEKLAAMYNGNRTRAVKVALEVLEAYIKASEARR